MAVGCVYYAEHRSRVQECHQSTRNGVKWHGSLIILQFPLNVTEQKIRITNKKETHPIKRGSSSQTLLCWVTWYSKALGVVSWSPAVQAGLWKVLWTLFLWFPWVVGLAHIPSRTSRQRKVLTLALNFHRHSLPYLGCRVLQVKNTWLLWHKG